MKALAPGKERGFTSQVRVLVGGALAGQLITLAASPILSRLYGPADFGVLAVFAALLGVIGTSACLRFDQAVPLPEDDIGARSVVHLALVTSAVTTVLVAFAITIAPNAIARAGGNPGFVRYLWYLPIAVFALGCYSTVSMWAVRQREFQSIALSKLQQAGTSVTVQIVGGLASLGPIGLVLGSVLNQVAGVLTIARRTRPIGRLQTITLRDLWNTARTFWRFPVFGAPTGVLNTLGLQLPALLLSSTFGPATAGLYLLAYRITAAPFGILSNAIMQVYYSQAARLATTDRRALRTLFVQTTTRSFALGVAPAIVVGIAGPWLFALVFGVEWREAGAFARWLAIMLVMQFAVAPVSHTFLVFDRQALSLWLNAAKALIAASTLLVPPGLGMAAGASVGAYAVGMAVFYATTGVLAWRVAAYAPTPNRRASKWED